MKSILKRVQVFSILITMTLTETASILYLDDQHRPLQPTLHYSQGGASKRQISSCSSSALKRWVAPYCLQNRVQLPCPPCVLQLLPHPTALFTTLSHLPPPPTPQYPEAEWFFNTWYGSGLLSPFLLFSWPTPSLFYLIFGSLDLSLDVTPSLDVPDVPWLLPNRFPYHDTLCIVLLWYLASRIALASFLVCLPSL